MRRASHAGGDKGIFRIDLDEAAAFGQTLNEVLHGLRLSADDPRVTMVRQSGQTLLERLLLLPQEGVGEAEIVFSTREAMILKLALEICIENMNAPEFSTRIGASVQEMLSRIGTLSTL